MNINKNTLIAICVIGIGGIVVLYQVLFNFIFPIALILFLLYVLKLLIKGENNEEIKDYELLEVNPNYTSPHKANSIEEGEAEEEEVKSIEEGEAEEEEIKSIEEGEAEEENYNF